MGKRFLDKRYHGDFLAGVPKLQVFLQHCYVARELAAQVLQVSFSPATKVVKFFINSRQLAVLNQVLTCIVRDGLDVRVRLIASHLLEAKIPAGLIVFLRLGHLVVAIRQPKLFRSVNDGSLYVALLDWLRAKRTLFPGVHAIVV